MAQGTFHHGTMRTRLTTPLLLAAALCAQAQSFDPIKDPDKDRGGIRFMEQRGQKLNTLGQPATNINYYTTGALPMVGCGPNSNLYFAWGKKDTVASTPDTTFCIGMSCQGEMASPVVPNGENVTSEIYNFYQGHLAETGVDAYHRVLYENVYPFTNLALYHGHGGVKMAIILNPGADPE